MLPLCTCLVTFTPLLVNRFYSKLNPNVRNCRLRNLSVFLLLCFQLFCKIFNYSHDIFHFIDRFYFINRFYFNILPYISCNVLSVAFLNSKAKNLLISWKLVSNKKLKYWFCTCVLTFVRSLSQVIMHLDPDFSCFSSFFALSLVDKVTTGTYVLLNLFIQSFFEWLSL